jgi:TfoX/Sxy family transcriptional regulator of competence genes
MAYDESLAERTAAIIARTHSDVEEKKMFGGLCFMVNGKMCVGVESERLMVRLDPARYDEALQKRAAARWTLPAA